VITVSYTSKALNRGWSAFSTPATDARPTARRAREPQLSERGMHRAGSHPPLRSMLYTDYRLLVAYLVTTACFTSRKPGVSRR
jgi:hypothetical protein